MLNVGLGGEGGRGGSAYQRPQGYQRHRAKDLAGKKNLRRDLWEDVGEER